MKDIELFEKEIKRDYVFRGKIFDVANCRAQLWDGSEVPRELICHSGGVCILPIDSKGNGYFVRQYRYGAGKILTEIPAGKLEVGEDPLKAALRELSEETGFESDNVIPLGFAYSSPAILSEKIYMYLALDLKIGKQHLDSGEYLEVLIIPFDKAYEMAVSGEFEDMKTTAVILKAKKYVK